MMRSISSLQVGISWDESHALPGRKHADIHGALFQHLFSYATGDQVNNVLYPGIPLALDFENLINGFILKHAFGIAQGAHYQPGTTLIEIDKLLLHIIVDGGLLCRYEARTHIHGIGTQAQCPHQSASIAKAAGGNNGKY